MSIETVADRHREAAWQGINDAIYNVAAIVVNHASGWDTFHELYLDDLQSMLDSLLTIRKKLGRNCE